MSDNLKLLVSACVFTLGSCLGLYGCVATVGMIFVIGNNDSQVSVWLGIPCFAIFLPVCILALRWRLVAGIAYLAMAAMWTLSVLIENHFLDSLGKGRNAPGDRWGLLIYSALFLAYGAFALRTEWLNWPNVLRQYSHKTN